MRTESALRGGAPRVPAFSPGKSALGKGWGAWGKDDENAFSRSAAKRLGPPAPAATERRPAGPCPFEGALRASTAERDRKAAHRAVPVRRRRSLTGIDSSARGSPSPPNRQQIASFPSSPDLPCGRALWGRFLLGDVGKGGPFFAGLRLRGRRPAETKRKYHAFSVVGGQRQHGNGTRCQCGSALEEWGRLRERRLSEMPRPSSTSPMPSAASQVSGSCSTSMAVMTATTGTR